MRPEASGGPITPRDERGIRRVALIGNPNTGKTTLFNRLCGLRHKTGNFPGTTQEARLGFARNGPDTIEIIDLPGIYSLELEQSEAEIARRVLAGTLAPPGQVAAAPDVACVIVDATNLERNLALVGETLRRRLPTVVVLNMMDLAARRGLRVDGAALALRLGCPVITTNARTGAGVVELLGALGRATVPNVTPPGTRDGLESWAEDLCHAVASSGVAARRTGWTDRLDRVFTHPVLGLLVFAGVMVGLFWAIFSLAQLPMTLIEDVFGALAGWIEATLPDGILREFLAGGVVSGLAGVLVFLPQICLLMFLISVLEDTGYLARAAFVMNRFLAPFGLSGHAFMPLLSSHACAIPGIMACRAIPDRRERLAAILCAPFMSCSARIPVYVLLTVVLFPGRPLTQALAFVGCYALGIIAGLASALLARRTVLRGASRPMALELPTYKAPSLWTALVTTYDRAWMFLKNAGTNILAICIVLWWLSAYPHVDPPEAVTSIRVVTRVAPDDQLIEHAPTPGGDARTQTAAAWRAEADALESRHALAHSFAGRLGRLTQPVFEPLGFDWKLTVGVLTSFAAREVFVGTMAVVVTGHDDAEDEGVLTALATATRDDGVTRIFTPPVSWALLVYYVLAMQCLPTLAVTARESGGTKWALLQLGWMSVLAWALAAVAFALAGGYGSA
ncbi:MAG: ferrous iron transporter B [Planctomycetota bacterium]|nr:ferrous iron transporter B [Planctomycetota bacterium]